MGLTFPIFTFFVRVNSLKQNYHFSRKVLQVRMYSGRICSGSCRPRFENKFSGFVAVHCEIEKNLSGSADKDRGRHDTAVGTETKQNLKDKNNMVKPPLDGLLRVVQL